MGNISNIPWSSHLDYSEEEHDARMIMGDPKAMAWAWIYRYAENLNGEPELIDDDDYYGTVTPDELIETALENLQSSEDRWANEYVSKGGLLEGISTDPTFWDKLAILKGLDIPQDKRNNFFSCSC